MTDNSNPPPPPPPPLLGPTTDGNTIMEQVKWKTTQVIIQAGAAFEVPVQVVEGSSVSWGFQTDGGDVAFSVLFADEGKEDLHLKEVIAKRRFQADENLVQGNVNVVTRGTLYLQWDNTYSWFKSKQLLYSVTLDDPAPKYNGAARASSAVAGAGAPTSPLANTTGTDNTTKTNDEKIAAASGVVVGVGAGDACGPASTSNTASSGVHQQPGKETTTEVAATTTSTTPLRVILGTMTFGESVSESDSLEMMLQFVDSAAAKAHTTGNGKHEIDTARMYGNGNVEILLAKMLKDPRATSVGLRERLYVATKANPFPLYNRNLRPESVLAQLRTSLASMGSESVDLFYLHAPDNNTPIEATLQACQTLYEQGRFRELGLSNYAAWQVVEIYHICKRRGWVLPTVYQGMYNAITRDLERELLPALRACNMRLYVYNPLAGGLLTGRYTSINSEPQQGRFAKGTEMGDKYQERFFKPSYFAALEKVQVACVAAGVSMTQAAIRWIMCHSALSGAMNDGVILGASNLTHLDQNLDATVAGPLPASIVQAFDAAWEICRPDCPSYFRT